jgi:hypothetical protein
MIEGPMRDSERYRAQAETVLRLAAHAKTSSEKAVYQNIAEGWRRLAAQAARNEEAGARPAEPRSFTSDD